MALPRIAQKLNKLTFQGLVDYANAISAGMTAQVAVYPAPVPDLATLDTDTAAMQALVTAWGPQGNRGSHATYTGLLAARVLVEADLVQLANYAENTTPYDAVNFALANWPIRNVNSPQGILQKAEDFRQFISRQVPAGSIKLKWSKPLGLHSPGNVKSWKVFRSLDTLFNNAVEVAIVTKTTFTDTPLIPFQPTLYYWVQAFNTEGGGVISDIVNATLTQP